MYTALNSLWLLIDTWKIDASDPAGLEMVVVIGTSIIIETKNSQWSMHNNSIIAL